MAGSTQIGTGAVVLTANADRLLVGLDRAKQATKRWADSTNKTVAKAGGGGGGAAGKGAGGPAVGGLVGGLAIAGPLGAGLAVATKLVQAIGAIPEMLSGLLDASGQGAGGPLSGMLKSVQEISKLGAVLLSRVISPLAPAFDAIATGAGRISALLSPVFDSIGQFIGNAALTYVELFAGAWVQVAEALSKAWPLADLVLKIFNVGFFVAADVLGQVVALAGQLAQKVGAWVGSIDGAGDSMAKVSETLFFGLRLAAKGVAELWQGFKYGITIVGAVADVIARMVASLVDGLGAAVSRVLMLSSLAAAAVGQTAAAQKLADAANSAAGMGDKLRGVADEMKAWGDAAVGALDRMVGGLGAEIDGMERRFNMNAAKVGASGHTGGVNPALSGALTMGSGGAFSLIAKNNLTGQAGLDRQQLSELKKLNIGMTKVASGIGNGMVIGVM